MTPRVADLATRARSGYGLGSRQGPTSPFARRHGTHQPGSFRGQNSRTGDCVFEINGATFGSAGLSAPPNSPKTKAEEMGSRGERPTRARGKLPAAGSVKRAEKKTVGTKNKKGQPALEHKGFPPKHQRTAILSNHPKMLKGPGASIRPFSGPHLLIENPGPDRTGIGNHKKAGHWAAVDKAAISQYANAPGEPGKKDKTKPRAGPGQLLKLGGHFNKAKPKTPAGRKGPHR